MKTQTQSPWLAGFALASAIACVHAPLRAQTITPTTPEADAWSFPYSVQPMTYSGIFQMDASSPLLPLCPHLGKTLTWAALNPNEGEYDFSVIDSVLGAAEASGYMVVFRLKASISFSEPKEKGAGGDVERTIPEWVETKYGIGANDRFETKHTDATHYKEYVAPWHAGVQEEFRKLLSEITRRRYLERGGFMGIYLHGMSGSFGEEMNVDDPFTGYANTVAQYHGYDGLGYAYSATHPSPLAEAIWDGWTKRMSRWAQYAGLNAYKVAWVGCGPFETYSYPDVELEDFGVVSGLGTRSGNLEEYFYAEVAPPKAGQNYINLSANPSYANGYVEMDWNHPLHDGRYWGDENEQTNHYTKFPSGVSMTAEVKKLCYLTPFLRAAQLGMKFLWTGNQPINWAGNNDGSGSADLDDVIPAWFTKIAGKGPAASPDALCWLREAQIRLLPGVDGGGQVATTQPWKNIERFLMQRDFPASGTIQAAMTVPVDFGLQFPYVSLKDKTNYTQEHTSRRTDVANGSRNIAFKLDPDFKASLVAENQPVQIRVHFKHVTNAPFVVRVARGGSSTVDIGTVNGATPDNAWKTATFTLNPANFPVPGTVLGNDIDFVIHATGTATPLSNNDITVRYVRVVRTTEIAAAPTIKTPPIGKVVATGGTARFSVHAEGPGTLTYQWRRNGSNLSDVTGKIDGATKRYLKISSLTSTDAGTYDVVVSNNVGTPRSVTSAGAPLQLGDPTVVVLDDFNDGSTGSNPTWTNQSGSGGTASITASNTAPLSPAGSYYANATFNAANTWKYVTLSPGVSTFGTTWVGSGVNAIRFWLKGNSAYSALPGNKLKLQLREGDTGERWSFDLGEAAKLGSWQQITAPLASFYLDGGTSSGLTGVLDLGAVDQIRLFNDAYTGGSITVAIDHLTAIYDSGLIDDFNDGETTVSPPWTNQAGSGGTAAISASNAGTLSGDGSYYADITYNAANTWKYATLARTPGDFGAAWSAAGFDTLRFYLKGNASYTGLTDPKLKVQLREGETGERWSFDLGNAAKIGSWQQITVPFGSLYPDGGNPSGDHTGAFDLEAIDQIRFYNNAYTGSSVTISVDRIEVLKQ